MKKSKDNVIHGSIKRKIVSSDLLSERANRDFDNENGDAINKALSAGGLFEDRKELEKVLYSDPILRNSHEFYEMSAKE